ncbi:GNAT family N-acetyltransferase [Tunturibacter empetritectus]|uniref:Ribosomal-protein-alanine N-acetyltransferase n=1 Tax=Tunturiibacter lichenicola TaxID=2051959 RepID=A0A7W8J8C1_9BACT|nr:N-acetyltransferase [Edaphobacter lichenicola]MBB5343197.1 ribosomal-protein-alanine N-acetyltransferase [Edaphobacter lichenicola]
MIEEIELQEYRPGYLDAMYALDQECFSPEFRFDRESMRAFAEGPDAIVRIALTANGKIAGFVIVHLEPMASKQRAYVVTLDVAEEYRRRGLAQRLLLQAEERAVAAGAQWMELHVFTGNHGAIRFYESSGYERVDVRRRFYGGAGLDAFVYRKNL